MTVAVAATTMGIECVCEQLESTKRSLLDRKLNMLNCNDYCVLSCVLFVAKTQFNANSFLLSLLLLFKQRYFRWNSLQIASLIRFFPPKMDLYNYCYYITIAVMAIQNSDDFIFQTVNAPKKKSQAL